MVVGFKTRNGRELRFFVLLSLISLGSKTRDKYKTKGLLGGWFLKYLTPFRVRNRRKLRAY